MRIRRYLPAVFCTALAVVVIACGGGGDDAKASGTPGTCTGSGIASINRSIKPETPGLERNFKTAPAMVIDPAKTYVAHMNTVRGEITLELTAKQTPTTVNSFVFLSCSGFYDGLTFHRYEPGFVIQGGDPRGNGSGGPGYKFNDEFSPDLRHDTKGMLSMANSGPNTNGSQFFITLGPAPHLNNMHSVFGKVTAGMNVAEAIRAGDVINNVSIEER